MIGGGQSTVYEKGDVVLLPFPFRDRAAAKVRPAVVVTGTSYNALGDLIVAAITAHPPRVPSDYALAGWKQARLVAPSTVRMQLTTVASSRVLYRTGRVPAADLTVMNARLRQLLDL
jgi:mRNA interferase MazF